MEENKNYKIVIRGGYGFANFGDDALMKIIHDKLKTYELEENMPAVCRGRGSSPSSLASLPNPQ